MTIKPNPKQSLFLKEEKSKEEEKKSKIRHESHESDERQVWDNDRTYVEKKLSMKAATMVMDLLDRRTEGSLVGG